MVFSCCWQESRERSWRQAHLIFHYLIVEVMYVTSMHVPLSESVNGKPHYREVGHTKEQRPACEHFQSPQVSALPQGLEVWDLTAGSQIYHHSISLRFSHHFSPVGLFRSWLWNLEFLSWLEVVQQFDQRSFYSFIPLRDKLLSRTGPRSMFWSMPLEVRLQADSNLSISILWCYSSTHGLPNWLGICR